MIVTLASAPTTDPTATLADKPIPTTVASGLGSTVPSAISNAKAVLQPTLFEGGRGGGAGPLALSLGTPCILSDINVNLELKGQYGTIFHTAANFNDLKDKLIFVDAYNYDYNRIANEVQLSSNKLSKFLNTILE